MICAVLSQALCLGILESRESARANVTVKVGLTATGVPVTESDSPENGQRADPPMADAATRSWR